MIGKNISHYKILEKLGEGGMGVVYKAEDTKLDRLVALKFLPSHLSQSEEEQKRFIHEAKAASALDHPNICNIYEINETEDDQMFIAMAYYGSKSLKDKINLGPLPIDEAMEIAVQIALGLAKAHEKDIVHRDIKPANILITEDRHVKIVDFGLAKLAGRSMLTKEGTTLGTASYMSPEQSKGDHVDQRTDIWSLGVVIYEMLTGEQPFKGDYEQAIIYSILNEDPQTIDSNRDDMPQELTRVITKALAKDPDNRYQTIGELLTDLNIFTSEGQIAQSYKSSKILKKPFQKWQIPALSVLVLLIASILYFARPFRSDSQILKSLAVLPFDNYTGNDELEYFVAGMHSSLIGDISKISALRVISKTTSNAYKDVEKSITDIASELNVDAVIEASVLSLGDSVRIQVKLVSAFPEEQQLWVQDYYEEKSQILNLYNKITKEISKEINIIMTPQEESLLAESKIVAPEAYDAFLKGQYYWETLNQDSVKKALEYFQLAIEKDPKWADPYVGLAQTWSILGRFGIFPTSTTLPNKYKNLNKALELDPNSARVYYGKANNAVWTEWDWLQGEKYFIKSLELNPNNALCRLYYAHLLMILRRSDEAVQQANLGLELDPLRPLVLGLYGVVMTEAGDEQSAVKHLEKALSIDPNFRFATENLFDVKLDAAYSNKDYAKWFELWSIKVQGRWKDEGRKAVLNVFNEKGHIAGIEEMFKMNEKYGNKGCLLTETLKAQRYIYLKKYDKAVEALEKAYQERGLNIAYITTKLYNFNQLKDNPRYIALLKKMKLPLP